MTEPKIPPVPTSAGTINGEPLDPSTGRPVVPPGVEVRRDVETERIVETETEVVVETDDDDAPPDNDNRADQADDQDA